MVLPTKAPPPPPGTPPIRRQQELRQKSPESMDMELSSDDDGTQKSDDIIPEIPPPLPKIQSKVPRVQPPPPKSAVVGNGLYGDIPMHNVVPTSVSNVIPPISQARVSRNTSISTHNGGHARNPINLDDWGVPPDDDDNEVMAIDRPRRSSSNNYNNKNNRGKDSENETGSSSEYSESYSDSSKDSSYDTSEDDDVRSNSYRNGSNYRNGNTSDDSDCNDEIISSNGFRKIRGLFAKEIRKMREKKKCFLNVGKCKYNPLIEIWGKKALPALSRVEKTDKRRSKQQFKVYDEHLYRNDVDVSVVEKNNTTSNNVKKERYSYGLNNNNNNNSKRRESNNSNSGNVYEKGLKNKLKKEIVRQGSLLIKDGIELNDDLKQKICESSFGKVLKAYTKAKEKKDYSHLGEFVQAMDSKINDLISKYIKQHIKNSKK